MAQIDHLSDAQEGTEEFDRLDILMTFVEAYKAKHYPIGPPSFEAVFEYELKNLGLVRING